MTSNKLERVWLGVVGVGVLGVAGCAPAARPPVVEARAQPVAAAPSPSPAPLPVVTPIEALPAIDLPARIGHYQARDAEWARGQPVVVGRDYDFAVAVSLGYRVGPALAASRRKEGNHAIAERLALAAPVQPEALLAALVERCGAGCPGLAGKSASFYGVLYGERRARLRVVLETTGADGSVHVYMGVSGPKPVEEFANDEALRRAFGDGVDALAALLAAPSLAAGRAAESGQVFGSCQVGDGEHIDGSVVSQTPERVVLQLTHPSLTARAACPPDAFGAPTPKVTEIARQ